MFAPYENRQDRRLAAIDHPRKARSHAYQSSPYTIDAIDEEGRNRDTTDRRFFYDNADRLVEAHGGLLQDFTFDYDQADNLTRMATPDGIPHSPTMAWTIWSPSPSRMARAARPSICCGVVRPSVASPKTRVS